jgi:hypothetical protein
VARRFAPLELDDLAGLAPKHGARLGGAGADHPGCAEGEQARWLQSAWVLILTRSASGVGALAEHRLEGLWDEPRSGTPRTIEDAGSKR